MDSPHDYLTPIVVVVMLIMLGVAAYDDKVAKPNRCEEHELMLEAIRDCAQDPNCVFTHKTYEDLRYHSTRYNESCPAE